MDFYQYNWSEDSEYHSQRNNALIPLSSCNTTSMIMALKQAGHELPHPLHVQAEDHLSAFLQSEKGYKAMKNLASWAFNEGTGAVLYPPNEVHAVLTWAVNELMDQEVSVFRTNWDIDDLLRKLFEGSGIALSGEIILPNGRIFNHVISLAGYRIVATDTKELFLTPPLFQQITDLIIDDPYGDYRTNYSNHRGNNILISQKNFLRMIKKPTKRQKWAHVIKSALL